jgi:hypothetical protein
MSCSQKVNSAVIDSLFQGMYMQLRKFLAVNSLSGQPSKITDTEAYILLKDTVQSNLAKFRDQVAGYSVEEFNSLLGSYMGSARNILMGEFESLYKSKINNLVEDRLDILPQGTRYYFSSGDATVVVIESPPQRRTIHFERGLAKGWYEKLDVPAKTIFANPDQTQFFLAFPYMVYVVKFVKENPRPSLYVFYRTEPLRSLEDKLCWFNLPNLFQPNEQSPGGAVCLNNFAVQAGSFAHSAGQLLDRFWAGIYNNILTDRYQAMAKIEPRLSSPWVWEAESGKDALFVLKVNWQEYSLSIGELIRKLLPPLFSSNEIAKIQQDLVAKTQHACENLLDSHRNRVRAMQVEGLFSKDTERAMALAMDKFVSERINAIVNSFCGTDMENRFGKSSSFQGTTFEAVVEKLRAKYGKWKRFPKKRQKKSR